MNNQTQEVDESSPRPWKALYAFMEDKNETEVTDNKGEEVGTLVGFSVPDAMQMIKCVNRDHAFDALVEALKLVIDTSYRSEETEHDEVLIPLKTLNTINAALKLAKGEV